ncbi:acyl-CoA dehydrogenase family protein [Nocardioides sp. zg-536]|uniref:Acyl-CoA dehydrogenase family protein n=1 Tax=Nocardioides faecalis TaxID=2803858 RepID=A0A938Y2F5_9ACTN|nr:acyl-CoA dehydrogenase [Nocardioides faecalis]MBM9460621.1 acyl-CoA dehydrogenase family protein [Nocardioides faecalis]QVI57460.1 acyl-CoA dehydrogenase family protein [Nocardioides faecalis]
MSLGISEDQVELADSLRKWAASLGPIAAVRAAEGDPHADFADLWSAAQEMGLAAIALPESAGGGGGTVLDQAVALEACAHELVPGGLLGASLGALLAGRPGRFGVQVFPGGVVWDGGTGTEALLLDADDTQSDVQPDAQPDVQPEAHLGVDLSARHASVPAAVGATETEVDPARRRLAITLAAAEAAGVARWCLGTAVDYAKVREQFGQKIGAFQAIKHLCAQMLETAEAVTAAAWDAAAAADAGDETQWDFAVDVAAAVCFDGAVEVAKSCIQVLGGIGFTFEHDAHLYLRRAITLRSLVGSADDAAERVCAAAVAGVRRQVDVDLEGRDETIRPEARATAERIAALEGADQRAALVEAGYLTPHWPAPYGLGADPTTQIVIDQELARAKVTRPDLVIAGWAVPTVLAHGTDEQRERFVRPSLLGELTWCQLFSEPGSGSDLASLRTKAVRVDGGWSLSGQKVWTSVAERADWGICLARTDPDVPAHKGITYFLLDMRSPGIEVRPLREITGEALFNEVFLDDVFVPDECVVAEPGDGWRLARTTLANERVAMASARLTKSVERAVALAATGDLRAAQRVAVGHQVALATVCGLLGVRTTLRALGGQGPGAESSVAKLLGVRSRQESSELVVTLQGDRLAVLDPLTARPDTPGQRGENLAADVWEQLNTRCLSIAGGTTQILRNVAGERILGLPR